MDERRAVIFDMDGVLVDTTQAHFESWRAVAAEQGVEVTWEQFLASFGRPNRETTPELFGRPMTQAEIREVDVRKERAFRRIAEGRLALLPGVAELLHDLRADGFRIGLGSSGPRENVEAILTTLGVAGYFEATVTGWDVPKGKPAPDVFLRVAEQLGVPPRRCLVIEDVAAGIRAAHAAGMKCVAVTNTHPASALAEAELVLGSLEGFTASDALRLLNGRPR